MRARAGTAAGQTWDLPVPVQGASAHARFFDHAGPFGPCDGASENVLPSALETASAPGDWLSRLNGWPMPSPTDASSPSLRTPTHGSGPMWIGRVGPRRGAGFE